MPNHITNVIEIVDFGKNSLVNIRKTFLNEENVVDFNKIYPIPECLKNFEPHEGIVTTAKALMQSPVSGNRMIANLEFINRERDLERYEKPESEGGFSKEEKELIHKAVENLKECGHAYWYDWQCEKWGTKWNAYSQPENGYSEDATIFTFQTAWAHPSKLMVEISKKCPSTTFLIKYADEDLGCNCGFYSIKDGVIFDADDAPKYSNQTPEQKLKYKKFAFELIYPGIDPKTYGYDEDFEYSDEVYDAYNAE